jgi:NitT/TauT family transport system substrate-binding protein
MAIVLQEALRAPIYAPFYVALARGAFAAEGVEVSFVTSPTPDAAPDGLMRGSVDVGWGGPMRVILTHEQSPTLDLVCFCEVVTRDPFFLVGKSPRPDFKLADLTGLRLGSVGEVPTPWICLQDDLRRAGIDPAKVRRVPDGTMTRNIAALARGELDVIQLFEPFVEELVATGAGYVWSAAAERGPTSYTTFYARRQVLETRSDDMLRLVRAILRTQIWLHAQDAASIAAVIQDYFPSVARPRLASCIDRYKRLGIWGRDPYLPRNGFDRLRDACLSGGIVKCAPTWEQAVDMRLADRAIAENHQHSSSGPLSGVQ